MDRFRYWRHQPSLSPPNYQFIYYSLDGKTRYTSEVPNHRSKFLMMWCPKCKHAAVSVYTRVSFYWDRKKDLCTWSQFRRCHQCLSQLDESDERCHWFGQTLGSRWQLSNIRPDGIIFSKETGDKHWTTDCLHVKTSVSIRHLWGHTCSCICLPIGFILSRLEKRYVRVGMILKMLSVLISIGRIQGKMWQIWSVKWKCWQSSNIRLDGIIFWKETGDTQTTTNCDYGRVISCEKNSSLEKKDPIASFGICSRHWKI